ncbi:helix-turn-helix domain-containing protein [Candidatus Tisiphia endosymbiont of Micropterix aruncella]|uniref:helix-turn-helix domain-containing protein n=1 Tax=Candidatus Tisiphia endosymbiont of Micropterix aruncella TaxID=3066271 RepID=UPI003AA832E0
MSTSPYSQDLREKVINYIEKGNSQISAAKIFDIHKNTINRWKVRKKKEGTILAKARLGFKSKVDKQQLEEFVKNNSNITLKDIGKKFGITGTQVGRILKKLGYSYKKNLQLFGSKCRETI